MTIKSIAKEAAVGSATVDRVLNGRGGVSEEMTARVLRALKKHEYGSRPESIHRGVLRIEVLLVRPDSPFFFRLNKAFERLAALTDRTIVVHRTFLPENTPLRIAEHIANPPFPRSGLILVAPQDAQVKSALIAARDAGVHIVQIVNRLASNVDFVGIDNIAAGRTAAFFMNSILGQRPGKVLALCHSGIYNVHTERISGFSAYFDEHPEIVPEFDHVLLGRDDDREASEVVGEALRWFPDVVGLYNAGGSNQGVASALTDSRRDIVWIGHELEDDTRAYLKAGLMTLAIDQAPEVQARRALDLILGRLGYMDEMDAASQNVSFVTVVAESIQSEP